MRKILITLSVLLLAAASVQAQSVKLLPASSSDLVAQELVQVPVQKGLLPGVSRDAVDFTYALDKSARLDAAPQPFLAQSREYFVDVDASSLQQGVTVYTTAPGALVRINPAAGAQLSGKAASLALDPSRLVVRDAAGVQFSAAEGLRQLVDAEQLKSTGVPFSEGTIAFRLAPGVGVGAIQIAAPALKAAGGTYTVHVFDQASTIALELGTARADYLHGDTLTVRAGFTGARVANNVVEGFVSSPGGRAWPIELTADGDGFVGQLKLDALEAPGSGLWEVHLAARGSTDGLEVVRSVRTAFAAHLPTASLGEMVTMTKTRQALELSFDVVVATPGRYEVRGVLYGTDRASGNLVPMALGDTANWFDQNGQLTLRFDIAEGFGAPFEVRDLSLLDQGRMGVLHRQARALALGR